MTQVENFFKEIAAEIPGVQEGKIFGSECITTANGRTAAMLWKHHLVVKLKGDDLREAMSLEGTKQFEPVIGHPMKEWTQISYDHKDKWKKLTQQSVDMVKHLKPMETPEIMT